MKISNVLLPLIVALCIAGCSTKREYFNPEENELVQGIDYSSELSSEVVYKTINGITLEDGSVIADGRKLEGIKLEKGEKFLGISESKVISSNLDGDFKVRDMSGAILYEKGFPVQVVSASIKGSDLAILMADNVAILIDMASDRVKLAEKFSTVFTLDSRTAAPLFTNDGLVVFPSLDGQLLMVQATTGRILADTYVSSEPFFNNIIFLKSVANRIYVATNTSLMSIAPEGNRRVVDSIKDLFIYNDRVYLFSKDGSVKLYDMALNRLAEEKFKFAQFSAVMPKGDKIYMFERQGYMIQTDLDLKNRQIYELDGKIKKTSFAKDGIFYYEDRYLELR